MEALPEESFEASSSAPPPPPTAPKSPVDRAFQQLSDNGVRFVDGQNKWVENSFAKGGGALVRAHRDFNFIVEFEGLEDLQKAAGLDSGTVQDPVYSRAKELQGKGARFYLPLEGDPKMGYLPGKTHENWLRTDAVGATLRLGKGKEIRVLTADGELHNLSKADQLPAAAEPPDDWSTRLDHYHNLGLQVTVEPPGLDRLSTQLEEMIVDNYKAQLDLDKETTQSSQPLREQQVLKALRAGETVQLSREGRLANYVMSVDGQELHRLAQFRQGQSPEDYRLLKSMEHLDKAGGMSFHRYNGTSIEGAMTRLDADRAILALDKGEPLNLLMPDGDQIKVTGLQEVEQAVSLAVNGPEGQRFAEKVHRVEDKYGPVRLEKGGSAVSADPVDILAHVRRGGNLLVNHEGQWRSLGAQDLAELGESSPAQTGDKPRVDPSTPKDNLVMFYRHALHNPSGAYLFFDDAIYKLKESGSSEQADMVVMHSDLFDKKNLRVDYVQPGQLENQERLPKDTSMADPKVFEDFVFNSLVRHPDREHNRLFVVGHGGAEDGTVDDLGPNGVNNIPVADFAGAISKALDRVEAQTGKRPVIDNLVMASCLMGNTSVVDELARRGDVKMLSASPEVLLNELVHKEALEYMNDPATSKDDAVTFAKKMTDIANRARGYTDGDPNVPHAVTYGAYDLDKTKAENFAKALDGFFKSCLAEPEYAAGIRNAIQSCPNYQLHPSQGYGPGSVERDLIQVCKAISKNPGVGSKKIREAALKLAEVCADQVVEQKTREGYEGREGPSMMFPMEPWQYPSKWKEPPVALLRDTSWREFTALVMQAPDTKGPVEVVKTRWFDAMTKAPQPSPEDMTVPNQDKTAHSDQLYLNKKQTQKDSRSLLKSAHATGAAVLRGAIGGITGFVAGLVMGGRAGATGSSAIQDYKPNRGLVAQTVTGGKSEDLQTALNAKQSVEEAVSEIRYVSAAEAQKLAEQSESKAAEAQKAAESARRDVSQAAEGLQKEAALYNASWAESAAKSAQETAREAAELAQERAQGKPAEARPAQPAPVKEEPAGSLKEFEEKNPRVVESLKALPNEYVGAKLHQKLRPFLGKFLATVIAAPVGAVCGALGGMAVHGTYEATKAYQSINP